ncbi:MAG TPA: thioredoxin domain-containing protein [Kofleriaceae bacterium]|nr:thioredoxin domain-containing protein [Kofleriaceae bacterium]
MSNVLNSYRFSMLALLCAPLLMGGACEKKGTKPGNDTGAIGAADRADDSTGPADESPLPNIDVSKLSKDKQKLFYKLLASFNSPCGKAHSLRTSYTTDNSCKRAPFAVRYLATMLEEEATEDTVREFWNGKYASKNPTGIKIDVANAPHEGNVDAPVKIYEFYDYACPHCAAFKKQMDEVLAEESGKVVTFFLQYPLEGKHPDSRSAAQAALAANAQGKFKEMHDLLFEKSPAHQHDAVVEYAKTLGLDAAKFEADYTAMSTQVTRDEKTGEGLGVDSTPTVFFNDRKYEGPMLAKYVKLWIDEELAVNR